MRKIYSLVLMATMLLIGINAWAVDWTNLSNDQASYQASLKVGSVTKYGNLNAVFNAIGNGDTALVKLVKGDFGTIIEPDSTIVIHGNADGTGDVKVITLDMNGRKIQYDNQKELVTKSAASVASVFLILHGQLTIINSSSTRSLIAGTGVSGTYGSKTIVLHGTPDPESENYSNLTIEQGVEVQGTYGGILIDAIEPATIKKVWPAYNAPKTINLTGGGTAFGTNVVLKDTVKADFYGIQVPGNVGRTPKVSGDDAHYPSVVVEATSHIEVDAAPESWVQSGKQPIGIYVSGYAVVIVKGSVKGANGILMKNGKLTVEGQAKVESNAPTVEENSASTNNRTGASGAGNAISMVTDWTDGTMEVTITGDPTISTTTPGGHALVDDHVNKTTNNEVTNVTIEGGTFTGDVEGCVEISDSFAGDLSVTGGTYTGSIETLIDNMTDKDQVITDVVNQNPDGSATVVIGKNTDGGSVVTPKVTPTVAILDTAKANSYVKLIGDSIGASVDFTITKNDTLKYLSLQGSSTNPVKVTIPSNKVMMVNQIVMNANAQIVVEAGAKLLVTGKNGVFANNVDNLILKANADGTAMFLMVDTVSTNRQPKATVQIYTKAYQKNASEWIWHRMSTPLSSYDSFERIYTGTYTTDDHLITWATYWNSNTQTWDNVPGGFAGMEAFKGYSLTNNTTAGGAIYAIKGNIQGVENGSVRFNQAGWNFFGNSYTAPIHLSTLLNAIWTSAPEADGTIWYYNTQNQEYKFENRTTIEEGIGDYENIKPFESFVIRLNSGNSAEATTNYRTSVWDYNTMSADAFEVAHPTSAPQRVGGQKNMVRISISDDHGMTDKLILLESDAYSTDYESGADAYKMMNAGLNIYAEEDEAYGMVASDNIAGTLISLTTNNEINYTLTFSNVRGEEFALRDNMTNAVVLMSEGATYNFTAQSNATLEGRFQIVSRQEMPTAVETIEKTVNAPKAIYTILGQYVGETTNWNNLPAGVYVVDGVKVIK